MQQPTASIPTTSTSHPNDPIPREPRPTPALPEFEVKIPAPTTRPGNSPRSSEESAAWSGNESSDSSIVSTPRTDPQVGEVVDKLEELPAAALKVTSQPTSKKRRASTTLIAENTRDIRRLLGEGETGTQLIEKYCCGGGCCLLPTLPPDTTKEDFVPVVIPDNAAFRSLQLKLGPFSLDTELTSVAPLPESTILFDPVPKTTPKHVTTVHTEPPTFVQPHPPYHVVPCPVYGARELTKPGADKRTFHFDIDVTDYPVESGEIDFKVGGAIGITPPNDGAMVDDIFDALGIPNFVRDKPILMKTSGGRWPTIWGDEQPRELVTTRRELLTWCTDIQSSPPTKPLLRLLAEHADAKNEKKILMYLSSAQGQASFCDLRTGPHVTLAQLLHAFPSARPPLPALLSVLQQLMPRFYSLSNDPHISSTREGLAGRRLIELAVSVHDTPDWHGEKRTGVGSGYLERVAHKFMEAEASGLSARTGGPASQDILDLKIPMFRGLMANPLSREFVKDGPMLLIGAGVGMAPFRGFILNRLKNANCANKVWLVQGVRDSKLDEIYSGELGDHESEIKHVVQSRKKDRRAGDPKYVQDELRQQADVVWFVINAIDGRVFVCGSSHGMGEGVEAALVDVAMEKGGLSREEAQLFWKQKADSGQYIAETW
ncbi:sulfite reductase flavo protein alpha-component [Rhizodiscina lignyota]|uniref:Sulfite reductase flavo protein alpha-component n=1 Tax=Rhizodiscina lignyota TaxID=1504668 RepID=A0A9P4ITU9_9PEZI|nr:sulfite reductase flavo protein alpha-component [Rhizodiscina lignyota]